MIVSFNNLICFTIKQIDVEYKLQDTKKLAKEWEMKVKAFRKRLDEIQTNLAKHMDQYVQMHHRRQAGGKHWKHQFDSIRFDPARLAQGIS